MTEYGRGSGSQPWHPEDPLYGDRGYDGQQYAQPQPPYGQQQHYPEQQQYGWDPSHTAGGQYAGNAGDPYAAQHTGGYGDGQQDPYGAPGGYPQAEHPQAQHPQSPQHPQAQQQTPYVGEQRQGQHEQLRQPQAPAGPAGDEWRTEPDEEKLSFFDDDPADHGPDAEDDAEAADEPRGRGRERRGKGKGKKNKRRSGTACLLVAVVLVGVVGGGGYLAYDYWQSHFGPAPDYEGEGDGQVQVEIPKGSSLTQMGQALEKAGVVKSVGAFTEAAAKKSIQPGTYTLRKEMSGAAAVAMMTDSGNFLTLREGIRAADVYAAIDKKLELKAGTTKEVAKSQVKNLGLPDWAGGDPNLKDPLEGFLFPSQYSAGKGTKPEDILRQMVARAKKNYDEQDLAGKAKDLGLKSPLQVITVASLVQVEGKYKHDFDKISRVIYNRLKPDNKETYGLLDFDSTVNYARSQSTLDTGAVSDLRKFKDPYNTYNVKGLPPGPISNPGMDALKSALEPTPGPWYYFVSVNENETLFAVTNEEHNKNRQRYEQEHKKAGS
ncbi:aminodeoxychorismate lyase [Streptomyces cinnamoneus]|uniref:Endolytic murein transglycosylase n=1 Tax=Streptomyces cinnamoneus TaxID=53446 RepID=A0A2G1XPU1_STRCJ|nr:endolytic transglycosylase MltG [Streptomyces cinnamoneus]PHQ53258.1 aminodeoxychorismate lyase [Streptomyces cinnamoneus]PPT12351.1 endolytic transglycosylase MltG [Streptomyces cinnamoneus]